MRKESIAPCGMNCELCVSFFGYTMNGEKRKNPCTGCRSREKNCAFLKKKCDKLSEKVIEYCFECSEFPCENLEKLDSRYREKYDMSMIKNLEFIEDNGIEDFLKKQEDRYSCPECGGIICVHNNVCYNCKGSHME